MPETKPKQKQSAEKPAAKKVELTFKTYAYPCALCGKESVGWDVNGEATLNPANNKFVQVPLKHKVCGQEIILDIRLDEPKEEL